MDSKPSLSRIGTATIILLILIGMVIPLGAGAGEKEPNEPNDAQGAATQITGESIEGEISVSGGTDWFAKEYSKGDSISVVVTKKITDRGLKMSLHAPNGTELDNTTARHGVDITELSAKARQQGKYGIKIQGIVPEINSTSYTIHTSYNGKVIPTNTKFESGTTTEIEPNDVDGEAQYINKSHIRGYVNGTDVHDKYAIQVRKGEKISFLLEKDVSSRRAYIFTLSTRDENGEVQRAKEKEIVKGDERGQIVIQAKRNGTHIFTLYGTYRSRDEKDPSYYSITVKSLGIEPLPSEQATTPTQATATAEPTEQATETPPKQGGIDIQSGADSESPNSESSTTELFGPGFTGSGAIVALLLTGLFGWRRS